MDTRIKENTMADVIETDLTTDPPTITERDFTPEELAQREADAAAAVQAQVDADAAVVERVALRASAEKKLAKLGLSVEEITAVLTP
jgi:hypothetical protein